MNQRQSDITPDRAIALLKRQSDAIQPLKQRSSEAPEFTKWRRDTGVAIQKIFGEKARHYKDFVDVRYSPMAYILDGDHGPFQQAFSDGLVQFEALLASMIDEITEYEHQAASPPTLSAPVEMVERICKQFHVVARQLLHRHSNRETLKIADEYDVQDLLHALLRLHFDDVRPEEWTPSYAGGSARMDFLLKSEKIVVEVKKSRPTLSGASLGADLLVDIARYSQHADCKLLFCFVYDPDQYVTNPIGLQADLANYSGALKVRAIICQK